MEDSRSKDFESIRPFLPEELPQVYDRLLSDPQFRQVVAYLYPDVPLEAVAQQLHSCSTNLEFQKTFMYPFLKKLMSTAATGLDMDISAIDNHQRYTFVSNHRDIVLDSALLDVLLVENDFTTTCEIAIGDNLLKLPWVKDLVRVNKSFIVERSLPMRQMLVASKRLSDYMHYAIGCKNENIWIAQREGRAKDSDDRTQSAILKMMAMGGEGSLIDRLTELHIVPLTISYEYDPCDYLKAKEFQQRRDDPDFKKGPMDDVVSMKTGIMGYKGEVHYHCAECIDPWLKTIDSDMPKGEQYDLIAAHIDTQIHSNYRIYANNRIALDLLEGSHAMADTYSQEQKQRFEQYIEQQLGKIDLPNADIPFLRERMLTMYANPLRNKLKLEK